MRIGNPSNPDDDTPIGFDGRSVRDQFAMSRAEVGKVLGCSRTLVEQIERSALQKCRRWMEARGLSIENLLPSDQDAPDCRVHPPHPEI